MNNEGIGVLGFSGPQRSVMDKRLQSEFDRTREGYKLERSNPGIGVLGSVNPNQRSVMDKMMQREYNPQKEHYEQRSLKDQMMMKMHNPNSRENYDAFSGYQNPYNPLSPSVRFAQLQ